MTGEIRNPEIVTRWIAKDASGNLVGTGVTEPHFITVSGQPDFVGYTDTTLYLDALTPHAAKFTPLPVEGELVERGVHYRDDSKVVIGRQDHVRLREAPSDAPDRFVSSSVPGAGIEWTEDERVDVGSVRTDADRRWRCSEPHVTQRNLRPPTTPSHWAPYVPEIQAWAIGIGYAIGDEVSQAGRDYASLQRHVSEADLEPPNAAFWAALPNGGGGR